MTKTFDLKKYFEEQRVYVEKELDHVLPASDVRPVVLHRAMRHAVMAGGKRIRPVLCLSASESVGGTMEQALKPAIALELLHSYTLVHDDLPSMDNDTLRRGKPTVHVAFGEANAILAGDALLTLAFEVLAGITETDKAAKLSLELSLSAGSTGIVGGQVEDISAAERKLTAEDIDYIHARKTAFLFRAAMKMGGIAGGADDVQLAYLSDYGMHLGLAFQITDDLLDSDNNETSCLKVHGKKESRKEAQRHINIAVESAEKLGCKENSFLPAIARFILNRVE